MEDKAPLNDKQQRILLFNKLKNNYYRATIHHRVIDSDLQH